MTILVPKVTFSKDLLPQNPIVGQFGSDQDIVGGERCSIICGRNSKVVCGDQSTVSGTQASHFTGTSFCKFSADYNAFMVAANKSNLQAGDCSNLKGINECTLISGKESILTGGEFCTLKAGPSSNLVAGKCSTLQSEPGSRFTGGLGSVFICTVKNKHKQFTTIVDGVNFLPKVAYTCDNVGNWICLEDAK